MNWRTLTPEQTEYHFNPQRSVPDFARFQQRRNEITAVCRRELTCHLDVAYGSGELHKLDILPAVRQNAPVHLFFHGGYWRAQDKANFAFVARHLAPAGVTAVIVNYELCPAADLDGVVSSALGAVEWVARHIGGFGGDATRITLSGNSAGAHLCSMALATDWAARGLPADLIKGAVMISGIFDPEPAQATTVNEQLRLSEDIVRRNDSIALPPNADCPAWLFAGGREPFFWVQQTLDYSQHLRRSGFDPEVHILPGYHHFNIMDQYLDLGTPICEALLCCALGRRTGRLSTNRLADDRSDPLRDRAKEGRERGPSP